MYQTYQFTLFSSQYAKLVGVGTSKTHLFTFMVYEALEANWIEYFRCDDFQKAYEVYAELAA